MQRKPLKPVPFVVNVQNGQNRILPSFANPHNEHGKENQPSGRQKLKFPITRAVLWNRSQTGKCITIASRNIQMYVNEKTLLLASRHGKSNNVTVQGFLIGNFIVDADQKLILQVDRFDPGRNIQLQTANGSVERKVPTAVIPGDHTISLQLKQGLPRDGFESLCSADEFSQSIEMLHNRCAKKNPVSVTDLFKSRALCYYQADVDELIMNFQCHTISFASEFIAKPINSVPIIPTALAKNLSGPMRLSQIQGNAKFGYLTMDQTRKLLVLLENDPKIETLPLVGIWVSGIEEVSHPYSWACCLKFLNADYVIERVLAPPSSFLLVHYPTTKAYPDFYECSLKSTEENPDSFKILSCQEQLILSSLTKSGSHDDICMELCPKDDANTSVFESSLRQWMGRCGPEIRLKESTMKANTENGVSKPGDDDDDSMPTPKPHPKPHIRINEVHPTTPSVPELSFLETRPTNTKGEKPYNPKMYQERQKHQEQSVENLGPAGSQGDVINAEIGKHSQGVVEELTPRIQVQNRARALFEGSACHYDPPASVQKDKLQRNQPPGPRQSNNPEVPQLRITRKSCAKNGFLDRTNPDESRELPTAISGSDLPHHRVGSNSNLGETVIQRNISRKRNATENSPSDKQEPQGLANSTKGFNVLTNLQIQPPFQNNVIDLTTNEDVTRVQKEKEGRGFSSDQNQSVSHPEHDLDLDISFTSIQGKYDEIEGKRRGAEQQGNDHSSPTEITQKSSNPLSLIAAHEQQLIELQQQIHLLLEQKRQEESKNSHASTRATVQHTSTSVQCSFVEQKPEMSSTSVNTGESLLLLGSADNTGVVRPNASCTCCCKCRKNSSESSSQKAFSKEPEYPTLPIAKNNNSHLDSASFANESCYLSDLKEADIVVQSAPVNNSSASIQSFASVLQAVDVPVFEDSQNAGPGSPNDLVLGESASMIASNQQNVFQNDCQTNQNSNQLNADQIESNIVENFGQEFYQQMTAQLKGLLSSQMENIENSESLTNSDADDDEEIEEMTEDNKMGKIEQATLKHLEELDAVQSTEMEPIERNSREIEAPQNGVVPFHPRINYVSIMANDLSTGDDDIADAIAQKYLTSKQLQQIQCSVTEHKTKSVKFEGLLRDVSVTPKRNMNLVSMNFACNMSIATKRYMQRYNLLDGEIDSRSIVTVEKDRRKTQSKCVRELEDDDEDNSDNILDFNKLKRLQKLI